MTAAVVRGGVVRLGRARSLDLARPAVMGVLNVTPDSFSDGGAFLDPDAAADRARAMVAEGAAVVDVGGESTRPGAAEVPAREELRRVVPVLERLADLGAPVSIDTRKAAVAREALAAGAVLVNDVTGLGDPAMAEVVAAAGAGLVIGHIRGTPASMQRDPRYEDVVAEVRGELAAARERALRAGVAEDALLVDPGIGFGKTLEHNLTLLARLERFAALGPVVVGVSRKAMLGKLTGGRAPAERGPAGLGAAAWAALHGASLVRTHDVAPTADALAVLVAIAAAEEGARGP